MRHTTPSPPPEGRQALLVVDVQRDFLPGGAWPVPAADRVVAPLAEGVHRAAQAGWPVILTRDWHPADHCSFTAQGGPNPAHAVAGSPGAAFADGLWRAEGVGVVSKGTSAEAEPRSAFDRTDLLRRLSRQQVRRLYVGGLWTEAGVLHTVLEASRLGFEVRLLADAVAARRPHAVDGPRALTSMCEAGAVLTSTDELLALARPRWLPRCWPTLELV